MLFSKLLHADIKSWEIQVHVTVLFHFGYIGVYTDNCSRLPGQDVLAHVVFSVFSPKQSLPPWDGAGLSQSRDLIFVPPPHEVEQLDHADQSPHSPFTLTKIQIHQLLDKTFLNKSRLKKNLIMKIDNKPWQIVSKQCCISNAFPEQSLSLFVWLHVRERSFVPYPQEAEQWVQPTHSDQ